jgi:hypothetical protein
MRLIRNVFGVVAACAAVLPPPEPASVVPVVRAPIAVYSNVPSP